MMTVQTRAKANQPSAGPNGPFDGAGLIAEYQEVVRLANAVQTEQGEQPMKLQNKKTRTRLATRRRGIYRRIAAGVAAIHAALAALRELEGTARPTLNWGRHYECLLEAIAQQLGHPKPGWSLASIDPLATPRDAKRGQGDRCRRLHEGEP